MKEGRLLLGAEDDYGSGDRLKITVIWVFVCGFFKVGSWGPNPGDPGCEALRISSSFGREADIFMRIETAK